MSQVEAAIATIAPNDSVERYTALGVDVVKEWAQLTSPFEVQINDQILSSRSIIMASGASPSCPIWPADHGARADIGQHLVTSSVTPKTPSGRWRRHRLRNGSSVSAVG